MNSFKRIPLAFFWLVSLLCSPLWSQTPTAKQAVPRSGLEAEQRIMREQIKDAEFQVSRGISAVGNDLPESAKVSILRGSARISQVDSTLKGHIERIERLAFSLTYSRETERKKLRESHAIIRKNFANAEDSLHALQRDMARKGFLGDDAKQMMAVLDTFADIIDEIAAKDPTLAAELEKLRAAYLEKLDSGDIAGAEAIAKLIQQKLEGAGYKGLLDQNRDAIDRNAGSASGVTDSAPPAKDATGPKEVSRRTLPNGAEEVVTEQTVTNPDGSKTVMRTVTVVNPDGSKDITVITENYDASGKLIGRSSESKKYDASGKLISTAGATVQGENLIITGPDGKQRSVPMSFFRGKNTASIYETRYIGGEGQVLTAEREITFKLKLGPAGEFQGADQTPGRERSWDFAIEEVSGARSYADDGAMQTKLTFSDRKLKADYKISGWSILNPAGKEVGHFGADREISAKLTESGVHKLIVTGETDWGNPFVVSVDLQVAL